MPTKKLSCALVLITLLSLTGNSYAITPQLYTIDAIDFGKLTPRFGTCEISYLTGTITNIVNDICQSTKTSRGFYRIVGPKNTNMQVTVFTHSNNGNGIVFTPNGKIKSSELEVNITPGVMATLNSGPSGWVDVIIGGRLDLLLNLAPGTPYQPDFTISYDIEP
ncbi:MAG: hypothetical protein HRU24_07260 [Gammaproteobacteria bacterium]|nr:hypothetical protein [Gammaproteobacteria bacterium]